MLEARQVKYQSLTQIIFGKFMQNQATYVGIFSILRASPILQINLDSDSLLRLQDYWIRQQQNMPSYYVWNGLWQASMHESLSAILLYCASPPLKTTSYQ